MMIEVGSKWVLKPEDGDPFPPVSRGFAEVLEVRAGWVRYYIGRLFPDNRMKEDAFLKIYQPEET